jgi:hypothetical protein
VSTNAARGRQQSFVAVEADREDGHAGPPRQVADPECAVGRCR